MKHLFLTSLFFFASSLAQERYLLHIDKDGRQEAIPLQKNENPADVISRLEKGKAVSMIPSAGTSDTLRYFTTDAQLTTNFGWNHQDVAFQYYVTLACGLVRSFYWYNYQSRGDIKKATIRAWMANPKLLTASTSVQTDWMGYYKDTTDGDGLRQPFKPASGDTVFYAGDTSTDARKGWHFDPTGTEARWRPGGLQVTLDSLKWQGIDLLQWGDTISFFPNEPFGFTLSNDSPPGGDNARLEILSKPSDGPPYHSMKYYETGRLTTADGGWWLRGDYEWGMYVVVELTSGPAPKIRFDPLRNTLKTTPRTVYGSVFFGNICVPPSSYPVTEAYLWYRIGTSASRYDSIRMTKDSIGRDGFTYVHGTVPGAPPDSAVCCYITASDSLGHHVGSLIRSYKVFKKKQEILLLYNNAQFSPSQAMSAYTNDLNVDVWSTPIDGSSELGDLLALYRNVVVIDGIFPRNNIYPELRNWLAGGSALEQRNLFFGSPDYGCFIQPACADTSFMPGMFEYDYLGVSRIGPQDLPPTIRPLVVVPLTDTVTNYIIRYNRDSATWLLHYPVSDIPIPGYPDAVTPTATAKGLFTTSDGSNILGVRKESASFRSMFVPLEMLRLGFDKDSMATTVTYRLSDVRSLPRSFMQYAGAVLGVAEDASSLPEAFLLQQNYPNPFNARTAVSYQLSAFSSVILKVYDVLGREVTVLVNERKAAGRHTVNWDASRFASGIYFYRLQAGNFVKTMKMILLK